MPIKYRSRNKGHHWTVVVVRASPLHVTYEVVGDGGSNNGRRFSMRRAAFDKVYKPVGKGR